MKTFSFNYKHGAALTLLLLSMSQLAQAQIVIAGTEIGNLATLSFDTGAGSFVLESSDTGNTVLGVSGGTATEFLVDASIDISVAELNTDWNNLTSNEFVSPGQTGVAIAWTVTNDSNTALDIALHLEIDGTAVPAPYAGGAGQAAANEIGIPVLRRDVVNLGSYAPGDDPVLSQDSGIYYIDELAANGGTTTIWAVFDVDADAVVDEVQYLTLIAQAGGDFSGVGTTDDGDATSGLYTATASAFGGYLTVDGNGGFSPGNGPGATGADDELVLDLVFADGAGDFEIVFPGLTAFGAGTANSAQHADTAGVRFNGAALRVVKTLTTIWDPVNANVSPKAIPGAIVQYQILIENQALAGGGSATLTGLQDITDADVDFDDGLLNTACATAGLVPPGSCLGLDGAAYTGLAGSLGVQVGWDNTGDNVADDTKYISPAAALNVTDQVNLTAAELLDDAGGEFDTGNGDGELLANEAVIIIYNVYVE